MNTKERIKELCKRKGMSVNKLETDLGFGTGYVSKLDKSTPNTKKIKLIADYFNVSVDYLMSGVENRFSADMADVDAELLMMDLDVKKDALKIASLTKEKRESLFDLIDFFIDKEARK